MLDSERTCKGQVTLDSFQKFCLRQQLFALKESCMETGLCKIFKTSNATNLTKVDRQTSNFEEILLLRVAFKILYYRVYCYSRVLVIKLI